MDGPHIETLFYMGIIIPTVVTIIVFVGFLICWHRCNQQKSLKRSVPTQSLLGGQTSRSSTMRLGKADKLDSRSQGSNDSAIDMAEVETSLDDNEKCKKEVVLSSKHLRLAAHSYQNEGMQLTADVHPTNLTKGSYPSKEVLNQEIHSPVRIYERMEDIQRVALHSQQAANLDNRLNKAQAAKNFKQNSPPRYTSTSQLPIMKAQTLRKAATNHTKELFNTGSLRWPNKDYRSQSQLLYGSSHYDSNTWHPNITASCSSNTDNYSTAGASQV